MLDAILAMMSLLWFFNTKFFKSWASLKLGGDQLSISLTALIVLIYLAIAAYGLLKWYYNRRY